MQRSWYRGWWGRGRGGGRGLLGMRSKLAPFRKRKFLSKKKEHYYWPEEQVRPQIPWEGRPFWRGHHGADRVAMVLTGSQWCWQVAMTLTGSQRWAGNVTIVLARPQCCSPGHNAAGQVTTLLARSRCCWPSRKVAGKVTMLLARWQCCW